VKVAFSPEDVDRNREYFTRKLESEKPRIDVLHAVEGTVPYDFVLLDTRGRDPFSQGHIPGAWSVAAEDLDTAAARLPRDREIVTYCWSHD
jgi:rhodanese-related sulfurtransferase